MVPLEVNDGFKVPLLRVRFKRSVAPLEGRVTVTEYTFLVTPSEAVTVIGMVVWPIGKKPGVT